MAETIAHGRTDVLGRLERGTRRETEKDFVTDRETEREGGSEKGGREAGERKRIFHRAVKPSPAEETDRLSVRRPGSQREHARRRRRDAGDLSR